VSVLVGTSTGIRSRSRYSDRPEQRIDPGGPDQGQPTHSFLTDASGASSPKAPANFANQTLTWTLVANGQTTQSRCTCVRNGRGTVRGCRPKTRRLSSRSAGRPLRLPGLHQGCSTATVRRQSSPESGDWTNRGSNSRTQ
jgi:hypothetical protein